MEANENEIKPTANSNEQYCHNCGAIINKEIEICPKCNVTQNSNLQNTNSVKPVINNNEQYCTSCGAVINKEAEICLKCGVRQKSNLKNDRTKVVAGILAILLGLFGVHKFYLGSIGLGIVYVLFCWTGIPAVIGLIEGIIYLTMTDDNFNRKYNM